MFGVFSSSELNAATSFAPKLNSSSRRKNGKPEILINSDNERLSTLTSTSGSIKDRKCTAELPEIQNSGRFEADEIYRAQFMVEAVHRRVTSVIQEIMEHETMTVDVDRLQQCTETSSSTPSDTDFHGQSSLLSSGLHDIPDFGRGRSHHSPATSPGSTISSHQGSCSDSAGHQNGLHDELYSNESDYSSDKGDEWIKSKAGCSGNSCPSIGSPSITIPKAALDVTDGTGFIDTGKLCKLILTRTGGIYSTRFVEKPKPEDSPSEKCDLSIGSKSDEETSSAAVETSSSDEDTATSFYSSSLAISSPEYSYIDADVETSSDFNVDIDFKIEESNGQRCVLCGIILPSQRDDSKNSDGVRQRIQQVNSNICPRCICPYVLWEREPWRWNLFLKRCRTKGRKRIDTHGEYCVSCNFWRRVDFINDAFDRCETPDTPDKGCFSLSTPELDYSLQKCQDVCQEIDQKSKLTSSMEYNSDNHDFSSTRSHITDDTSEYSSSNERKLSESSFSDGKDVSCDIVLEEDRLKSSHYYETGVNLPRVKYVCRNQETVLGTRLPRATFPLQSGPINCKEPIILSAMAQLDKESLWEELESSDDDDEVPCWPPSNRPKPLCKSSATTTHVGVKNSEDQCKSSKVGGKRRRDDSGSKHAAKSLSKRTARCRECKGCLATDCGTCINCLDMPKFGGPGVAKQACVDRQCELLLSLKRQRKEKKSSLVASKASPNCTV